MKQLLAGVFIVGAFMLSLPTVLAGPLAGVPCSGDFNYDGNVDSADVTDFLAHFGRNQYNDPCPPSGPAMVEKTGQTTSYATGDDGDLEKGVPWPNPRFTDNSNGTISDNLTGLIWLKSVNCIGSRPWGEAVVAARELSSGHCELNDESSAGDWRLPNRFELESLLDLQYWQPALPNTAGTGQWTLNNPFKNLDVNGTFWSSTTESFQPNTAWTVDMFRGIVDVDDKYINPYYVWPVRGGR